MRIVDRHREPDGDLQAAIENNDVSVAVEDINTVLAEIPGENDEFSWHWICRLSKGDYAYFKGSCDYTGWD